MAIKARYTGDGSEYLNGIPARNLSDEEYEALDREQKHAVRTSGLYEIKSEAARAAQKGGES